MTQWIAVSPPTGLWCQRSPMWETGSGCRRAVSQPPESAQEEDLNYSHSDSAPEPLAVFQSAKSWESRLSRTDETQPIPMQEGGPWKKPENDRRIEQHKRSDKPEYPKSHMQSNSQIIIVMVFFIVLLLYIICYIIKLLNYLNVYNY